MKLYIIGSISLELYYQDSWILSIIFALLIVDNVKFNLHVHQYSVNLFYLSNWHCCCLNENASKCVKTLTFFYIVAFLVCQEYTIIYANGRLACLMQGMLGVLVERYEISAYDVERQEAPMTCHVVDVRVLQCVVKTAISWTRICAVDSKLPLLLLVT